MGISEEDYKKILNRTKRPSDQGTQIQPIAPPPDKKKNAGRTRSEDAIGIIHIKRVLTEYNLEFTEEKKFTILREFRFDFAIEKYKIAVEYEGIMAEKSRHTTIAGYSKDTVKYNMAAAKGWKVFRYTTINYQNFELDLLRWFYHNMFKNGL